MTLTSTPSIFLLSDQFFINPSTHQVGYLKENRLVPTVKIEPKTMAVLLELMQTPQQVVTREVLIEKVWDNYGGAEEGLFQAISKLRKALGDNARQPKVIQTIPTKGYRLLLNVRSVPFYITQGAAQPKENTYQQMGIAPSPGIFTGFIERLTKPLFFLVFLVFSFVVMGILGLVYQILFWL